ncbi:hypothetical protein BRADI_2g12745v3, partial [Brachypodium distachyon]
NPTCRLCRLHPETASHIFTQCSFATRFWIRPSRLCQLRLVASSSPNATNLFSWWRREVRHSSGVGRLKINTLIVLVCWFIWLERNRCVFNDMQRSEQQLCYLAIDELADWKLAGFKGAALIR